MENILNTSEIIDPYGTIKTLMNAIKTTIQINEISKSKLLNGEYYFNQKQLDIIYENVDLLDDNSLILNQAIQAIKTLLTEIKNLKEIKANDSYIQTNDNFDHKNNNIKKANIKTNTDNDQNIKYFDSEILNRYDIAMSQKNNIISEYFKNQNLNNPQNIHNDKSNLNKLNNKSNNYSKSEDEIKILDGSIKTNISNNYNNSKSLNEKFLNENVMKLNFDYSQFDNLNYLKLNEDNNKSSINSNIKNQEEKMEYIQKNNEDNKIFNHTQNQEKNLDIKGKKNQEYLDINISYEKKPLRQKLISTKTKIDDNSNSPQIFYSKTSVTPQKDNKNDISIHHSAKLSNIDSSMENENISIEIIKVSNEIMKNIEVTEKYSDYFSSKFSAYSYKGFLNNIIEYKYDIGTLENILKDIKIKIKIENMNLPLNFISNQQMAINTKKNNNISSKMNLTNRIENQPINMNNERDFKKFNVKNLIPQQEENEILFYENNPNSTDIEIKNHINASNRNFNNNKKNSINEYSEFSKEYSNRNYSSSNHINSLRNINKETLKINNEDRINSRNNRSKDRTSSLNRNSSIDIDKNRGVNVTEVYEKPSFEKILRSYSKNNDSKTNKKKKPFNQFTKVHGNFFEKNILKKNSSVDPTVVYENNSTRR